MKGIRPRMRPNNPRLGEMTIKVPAPFAGISDLGFTAQYRAQQFNEPQRDVPLLIEGPQPPMRRLAELLRLLSGTESAAYEWSNPVMLSDEVVVLAFRDRIAKGATLSDGAGAAEYVMNLVCPVVFTFLRDCATVAHLRLSEVIDMRVSSEQNSVAELSMPLEKIVRPNGERLLWGLSA